MTLGLENGSPDMPGSPMSGGESEGGESSFQLVDFSVPQREKAMVHSGVDPPLCPNCHQMGLTFFDPGCPGCHDILLNPSTTIPDIFAVLRQWTPQTQQNLELLVREVLKRGGHVDDRDGLTDMTLLHYAAKSGARGVGDVDEACRMVSLLISQGADVYIRCRWTHMTALHYAAYFDVDSVIKLLLKESQAIDVDSPCTEFDRGTPLHIAATNLAYESAKVLLHHGASVSVRDDMHRTPQDCIPDDASLDGSTESAENAGKLRKVLQSVEPVLPAEPNPSYDSVSSKVTLTSMGLKVGDKVMVGGVKSGLLRYCGPTEFAPGVWAGIELEEPAGKNDGGVGGISYFKCSHNYGIFAPISKISKPGLHQRSHSAPSSIARRTSFGKVDTSHVAARVDTGLSRVKPPTEVGELAVGDRVIVAGQRRGIVQYSGHTDFASGWWYGIELDRPVGKNNGEVNGKRYFNCKAKFGVFAPPSRVQVTTEVHDAKDSPTEGLGSQSSIIGSPKAPPPTRKESLSRKKFTSNAKWDKKWNQSPKSCGPTLKRSLSASSGSGLGLHSPASAEFKLAEGMSVFCNNELGVVRYLGGVDFADGVWLGVELRTPKGKNDGSVQGRRYFTCRGNHGLLVRPSKVTVRGINGARLLGESGQMPTETP